MAGGGTVGCRRRVVRAGHRDALGGDALECPRATDRSPAHQRTAPSGGGRAWHAGLRAALAGTLPRTAGAGAVPLRSAGGRAACLRGGAVDLGRRAGAGPGPGPSGPGARRAVAGPVAGLAAAHTRHCGRRAHSDGACRMAPQLRSRTPDGAHRPGHRGEPSPGPAGQIEARHADWTRRCRQDASGDRHQRPRSRQRTGLVRRSQLDRPP